MHLCVSDVHLSLRTTEKSAEKMSIDLKDRFSNTSILSILTRSYTRTTPVNGNNSDSNNNSVNDSNANVNSSSNSNSSNNNSGAKNASLNSISTSTTTSCKVSPVVSITSSKDPSQHKQLTRVNGRDVINEPPKVSTLFSRFNITSSITNLNPRPKMLGKRISKGPGSNIYVRIEEIFCDVGIIISHSHSFMTSRHHVWFFIRHQRSHKLNSKTF